MRFKFIMSLALVVSLAAACMADQLTLNSLEVSNRAAAAIKPNSVMVSYCSECNDEPVQIWWVKRAVVTASDTPDLYGIEVFGKRLYRSKQKFASGGYKEPVTYKSKLAASAEGRWFLQPVDLAYLYVPTADGSYRVLGKVLDLPAEVKTERINLPADITRAIAAEYAGRN